MNLGMLMTVVAAVFSVFLASSPTGAIMGTDAWGDQDEATASTHKRPAGEVGPASAGEKKVALSHPDAPYGCTSALSPIVEVITQQLQTRIDRDFDRFLDAQMKRQSRWLL